MTVDCTASFNTEHAGGGFSAFQVTFFDLFATAAYRMVAMVETALQNYTAHRGAMQVRDTLERLNDHYLADIGISREDLTVEGLLRPLRHLASSNF